MPCSLRCRRLLSSRAATWPLRPSLFRSYPAQRLLTGTLGHPAMLSDFLEDLAQFEFVAYEQAVRVFGRTDLPRESPLVTQIHELARHAKAALDDDRTTSSTITDMDALERHAHLRHTVTVMYLFLEAQSFVLREPKPRYEQYASIPLLRRVLQVYERTTLEAKKQQIWTSFQRILDDSAEFERSALNGEIPCPTREFDPGVAVQRIRQLENIRQAVPENFAFAGSPSSRPETDLRKIVEGYGDQGIIERLLVFPQTTYHDETSFIRLIQLAECLFWGSLIHVQRALNAISLGALEVAILRVREASEFASPLVRVFQAVSVMPPAHFLSFRQATDQASAIQSLGWQLLDAHVYGVLPEKLPVLMNIPEVSENISRLRNSGFTPLLPAVARAGQTAAADALRSATVELEHQLRAWRKFHEKRLAGRSDPSYLPPGALGTGGTSGYEYLASQHPPRLPAFSEAEHRQAEHREAEHRTAAPAVP